jgi:hypothetical protein
MKICVLMCNEVTEEKPLPVAEKSRSVFVPE